MRFESDQSVLSRFLKNVIEDLQQFRVSLLVIGIRFEQPEHLLHARRDHAQRVADQERADRRTTNDDEVGPLHQDGDVRAVHRASEQDAPKTTTIPTMRTTGGSVNAISRAWPRSQVSGMTWRCYRQAKQ